MTATFFDELAAAQTPAPVKRKLDAAERRRAKARQAEQELKDERVLSKLYRQSVDQERNKLREGPHGKDVRAIEAFLKTMTLSSAPALIALIGRAKWALTMNARDRLTLLQIISGGIVACREKAGLPPFDDEILFAGEKPKAHTQIKILLDLDGR